jgi:signal peptidase I
MEEGMTSMEPEVKNESQDKAKPKKSIGHEILSWIFTLAVAVVIALVIRTFIFEPVKVDGHSMDDTLADKEIMFVSKWQYSSSWLFGTRMTFFGDPERFDVVVCRYPDRGYTNFVKRVVGLPGDTIEIKNGYLYVNNERYDEPYINDEYRTGLGSNYPAIVVPEGQYFVMGDHRNNSNDSRFVGPIDRNMIMGHVVQVVFPFSAFRSIPNGLNVE